MICNAEKLSPTQTVITVQTPYSELEGLLPKTAEAISAEIEIEGFRRGHAPYEIVRQKVGEFNVLEEAARIYIRQNFEKVLKEVEEKEFNGSSFEPVGEPQVAITKLAPGENLEYKITLSLLPAIKLPDYKTVAKRVLSGKKVTEVTEAEVESSLRWLRESRAKLITVNRGAQTGDRVEVDFSAKHGGVKLENGESKNHPFILGQGKFLPGFEDNLIGMKSGEEKTFVLGVAQDWKEPALSGKSIEFTVKMNLVQERDVPAWGDEFAKSLGEFSSSRDVEKNIRHGLRLEKEAKERERLRMAAVEAIASETKAEIPDVLTERELEKMTAELKQSIENMGLKYEDYIAHIKKTDEDLKKEWGKDAERRVKIALVLREIARIENIQPSEEEIQAAMDRTAAHRSITEDEMKHIDRQALFDYSRGIVRNEKVFQLLESFDL
mgnify:CR=1 FL=1